MPDVAMRTLHCDQGTLDWVGMNNLRLPIQVQDGKELCECNGSVQIYVDLRDPHAKGIHMSRLYVLLDEASRSQVFSPASLQHLLQQALDSHLTLSSSAYLEIRFERTLRRDALVSPLAGWGSYPAFIRGMRSTEQNSVELGFTVKYSSTCPASAALARQAIQRQFEQDFDQGNPIEPKLVEKWLGSNQGVVATPHGQRSEASVTVCLADSLTNFPLTQLIDQTEQEFARLNGQNPMFCEDASRRLKQTLEQMPSLLDFLVRVEHFESLHAHNVVSWVSKGIPGGLRASPHTR